MLKSTARSLRELLEEQRILSLAVVVDGAPFAGLLPFVALPDCTSVLVHASKLARHSKGLHDGARVSILLHEQYAPGKDALQIKRASFECTVHPLERNGESWNQGRERYIGRFPDGGITFTLGDFTLYRLELKHGLYIAGFGRAIDIASDDIAKIATLA